MMNFTCFTKINACPSLLWLQTYLTVSEDLIYDLMYQN